jgi:hypothetical protein
VTSFWDVEPSLLREKLTALCARLCAPAAGCWRLDTESRRLTQVAFVPAPDLSPEVAKQFADATSSVPLTLGSLGIVRACLSGQVAVSRVADLPADSGSGRWLRAFGADRSVAVPLRDEQGAVRGVVSVALPVASEMSDDESAEILLRIMK